MSSEVDDYIANQDDAHAKALRHLRAQLLAALPNADEGISYGIPAYRVVPGGKGKGKVVCGFSASKKHCALVLFDDVTIEAHAELLVGHDTTKSQVRFADGSLLSDDEVKALVTARLHAVGAL